VLPAANVPGPYPINFFLLNPYAIGANQNGRMTFIDDTGWSSYNGMQVEFRQRFSNGLIWTTNYTWSKSLTNLSRDTANQDVDFTTLRNIDLDKRVSPFDIRHVIQSYGTYDLPIGRGRKYSPGNSIVDGVIGGWTVGSIFVFHTGQPIQLSGGFQTVNNTNNTAANGVRLAPGVTLAQIQDMFNAQRIRLTGRPAGTTTDLQRLAVDPSLIGPDFRANPQFLSPNRVPGEFGQLLFLRDKNAFTWDASITKSFKITEGAQLTVFASLNNVLNHPRWAYADLDGNNRTPVALNTNSTLFGVMDPQRNPQPSIVAGSNRTLNLRATFSF
jgi:hypothetical protein